MREKGVEVVMEMRDKSGDFRERNGWRWWWPQSMTRNYDKRLKSTFIALIYQKIYLDSKPLTILTPSAKMG